MVAHNEAILVSARNISRHEYCIFRSLGNGANAISISHTKHEFLFLFRCIQVKITDGGFLSPQGENGATKVF